MYLDDVRWVIFVIDGDSQQASGDELQRIDAFNDELRERGYFELAVGIADPTRATLYDYRGSAHLEESVSLNEVGRFYSGFWVISTPDRPTAEKLARAGSHACHRRVELRPVLGGDQ